MIQLYRGANCEAVSNRCFLLEVEVILLSLVSY